MDPLLKHMLWVSRCDFSILFKESSRAVLLFLGLPVGRSQRGFHANSVIFQLMVTGCLYVHDCGWGGAKRETVENQWILQKLRLNAFFH